MLVRACDEFGTLLQLAGASGLICLLLLEPSLRALGTVIRRQPWWLRAKGPQSTIMVSFGYAKEAITEKMASETFAWTVIMCAHHTMAGLLLVPVNVSGWAAAGSNGREMFVFGLLLALGFDAGDFARGTLKLLFPGPLFGEKMPLKSWIVMDVLHHTTSIMTIVPLCRFMIANPAFHRIPLALLLAAGICYATGQYKFTLDVTKPSGMIQVKAIALWLDILERESFHWALGGTFVGIVFMSLFNIVMVLDATQQVVKWLAKPMPRSSPKRE